MNITVAQIGAAVTFLVGLITGIAFLYSKLKGWLTKLFNEQLNSINASIKGLEKRIDAVDTEACKNYLVDFLSRVDKGQEVDEIERERFWEQYQHYKTIGGNSYIKHKVEQLEKDGRL